MVKKKCNQCKKEKELDEFYRAAKGKLGRRPKCKICEKKRELKKPEDALAIGVTEKKCAECGISKKFSRFHKSASGKYGVLNKCAECCAKTRAIKRKVESDMKSNEKFCVKCKKAKIVDSDHPMKRGVCKDCQDEKILLETNTKEKQCSRCKRYKSLEEFRKSTTGKYGRNGKCRICEAERDKELIEEALASGITKKKCSKCKVDKPLDNFYLTNRGLYGRYSICKLCKGKHLDINKDQKRKCTRCNKLKRLALFNTQKYAIFGKTTRCSACIKELIEHARPKDSQSRTKECSSCKNRKSMSEFAIDRTTPDALFTRCKQCINKQRVKRQSTLIGFVNALFTSIRSGAKRRSFSLQITKSDIINLFNEQKGLCALTGMKMTHIRIFRSSWIKKCDKRYYRNLSVDRIDSKKGYCLDNIQLVCYKVNNMKLNFSQDFFINACTEISGCFNTKNTRKDEEIKYDSDVLSSFIDKLFRISTRNAKKRNILFLITEDDVMRLYHKQNGRCALSGRQMTHILNSVDNISVDRIDSMKSYTLDNIQLTCVYVNKMKWDLKQDMFIEFCEHVANYADN
uniref:Zn-finger protein n=1 Tax=Pithovirus LCPAC404 TaxID=2506597 RepID=A0A481ZBN7_9VIRU|nr:MAG: hypothetical protein LCPAC404_00280 [Pithovirus LCPAC404]